MASLESVIRKHALKNAHDFGKANAGSVVGKVIGEVPDCKKDMKKTMQEIRTIVSEVNKIKKEEIEAELKKYEFKEKPKEEKKEFSVPNAVEGTVVTRFPPEPNGYPHIGHAKAFCLSWAIAKNYNGKVILRWDDTNPEAEKTEFVSAIREGIRWLGLDWDEEIYCSDYMNEMYELCEKLIAQGDGYVCFCSQEKVSKGREDKKRCSCASHATPEQLATWKKMILGNIPEGGATIRFKGEMTSLNTVMRDPTLFRMLHTPHYRQGTKYHAWPTYDFQGAVMDSILGITHPIRSKEYELRDELYIVLLEKLNLRVPGMLTISRLEIKNAPISKRLMRPFVENGKLKGWDDPRLPTLKGLARRGILPEAIRTFVLSFGLSKVESEPTWDKLLSENRKLLDKTAKHYFFVPKAVKVPIDLSGEQKYKMKGEERTAHLNGSVLIPQSDLDSFKKNEILALKDLAFVKCIGKEFVVVEQKEIPQKKIQWASPIDAVHCEVIVPHDLLTNDGAYNEKSLERVEGYAEKTCMNLTEGDIIQFERFGFCRVDKKEKNKLTFVFSC